MFTGSVTKLPVYQLMHIFASRILYFTKRKSVQYQTTV